MHLVTIGDEILIGQIIDTNSAWMGEQLNLAGFNVEKITTVPDSREGILDVLENGFKDASVMLMTGGLGPTKDDITKTVLAEYLDTTLVFHQPTFDRLEQFLAKLGRKPQDSHRHQCHLPATAEVLTNKMGTAPGLWMETPDGNIIVSMPGVPYEMKYLMEHEVIPRLLTRFGGGAIAHRTLLTVGEGESRIANRVADIEAALPTHIKLAFLPRLGEVRLRLSGTGPDAAALDEELDEWREKIRSRIPELVFGQEKESLEEAVGHLLRAKGLTLGTAESCTGGQLAARIAGVPGASAYYEGSVIAYSYALKVSLLGVAQKTLDEHGAVSEETVREMATGARKHLGVDIAVAISGIAGPGGGTPEKPVGTIWLAIGDAEQTVTRKLSLGKSRQQNIAYTVTQALNMVRQLVSGE